MDVLKKDVQGKFDKIREVINLREKLLLRQIDAISSNNKSFVTTPINNNKNNLTNSIKFTTENEESILNNLRTFGKFNLDNFAYNDIYVNEDEPIIEHDAMYKQMPQGGIVEDDDKIIVDFSSNKKLIKDNVNNLNESIINITLNETKELINLKLKTALEATSNLNKSSSNKSRKSLTLSSTGVTTEQPLLSNQLENNSKSCVHSQLASNILKNKSHSKIKINNCNGTINLKNISNLVINCTKNQNDSIAESQPIFSSVVENDNSNMSAGEFDAITNSTTKASTDDNDNDEQEQCGFYNRLLQKTNQRYTNNKSTITDRISPNGSIFDATNNNVSERNRKFILKNFENLKIIMESTGTQIENQLTPQQRPVHIEQWLAEIISETENEPMQNIEILKA